MLNKGNLLPGLSNGSRRANRTSTCNSPIYTSITKQTRTYMHLFVPLSTCRSSIVSTPVRAHSGTNTKSSSKRGSLRGGKQRQTHDVKRTQPECGDNFILTQRPDPAGQSMTSSTLLDHEVIDCSDVTRGMSVIPVAPPLPKLLVGGKQHEPNTTGSYDSDACATATPTAKNRTYSTHIQPQNTPLKTHQPAGTAAAARKESIYCTKILERARTPDDMRKWREWRTNINAQLSTHVLTTPAQRQHSKQTMTAFPNDFTEDNINAILMHSIKEDEPVTSLDKLSYMIYGIPRANTRVHNDRKPPWKRHPVGKYMLNSTYCRPVPAEQKVLNTVGTDTCKSVPIVPTVMTQMSSAKQGTGENLFMQTNTPSNIPRYLPTNSSQPTKDHQNNNKQHVMSPIAVQTVLEASSKLQRYPRRGQRTAYPEPHSPEQLAVRPRPPVPGAVPTILSGLQPYNMTQLRHVSIKQKHR